MVSPPLRAPFGCHPCPVTCSTTPPRHNWSLPPHPTCGANSRTSSAHRLSPCAGPSLEKIRSFWKSTGQRWWGKRRTCRPQSRSAWRRRWRSPSTPTTDRGNLCSLSRRASLHRRNFNSTIYHYCPTPCTPIPRSFLAPLSVFSVFLSFFSCCHLTKSNRTARNAADHCDMAPQEEER